MLTLVRRAVCWAYGEPLPLVEKWALQNSTKASPDEIIAAAVIQSIAGEFNKWVFTKAQGAYNIKWEDETFKGCSYYASEVPSKGPMLRHPEKDITVQFMCSQIGGEQKGWYHFAVTSCHVNGVEVSEEAGRAIKKAYLDLRAKAKATAAAEAKALADMKRNEAAWNLAEKLLGMKRNAQGALEPVVKVEEVEPVVEPEVKRPRRKAKRLEDLIEGDAAR